MGTKSAKFVFAKEMARLFMTGTVLVTGMGVGLAMSVPLLIKVTAMADKAIAKKKEEKTS